MSSRKLAVITGGTSGIGLAIARALSPDTDLALVYESNTKRAEEACNLLRTLKPKAEVKTFALSLKGSEEAKALQAEVKKCFGRDPDILVHSAGRARATLFLSSNMEAEEALIGTHLIAGMALAHAFLPGMYRKKFGRIIFLSSTSARFARKGQSGYAAAKSGIEAFTRTLALEVAHRGITVNAIAPGLIETAMTERYLGKIRKELSQKELQREIPVGFVGTPDDIGPLAAYLCSDAARYMTGTILTIDGGRSLGDSRS